jgi:hypothetical protein
MGVVMAGVGWSPGGRYGAKFVGASGDSNRTGRTCGVQGAVRERSLQGMGLWETHGRTGISKKLFVVQLGERSDGGDVVQGMSIYFKNFLKYRVTRAFPGKPCPRWHSAARHPERLPSVPCESIQGVLKPLKGGNIFCTSFA